MAVRVTEFEFKGAGRRPHDHYPWGTWGNGDIYRVRRGEDFSIKPASFQQAVYQYAYNRGLKAHVSVNDDTVTFQVIVLND